MASATSLNSCKSVGLRKALTLVASALICAFAAPVGAQELRVSQPNAAGFPEIAVYAYPTDARGLLVPGLTAADFTVTENGLPALIRSVTTGGTTLDLCLVLDCSRSMLQDDRLAYARAAAGEFSRQLGPTDRAAFITFADRSSLVQPLTGDRASLQENIAGAQVRGESTAFYDALYWGIGQVALEPMPGSTSMMGFTPARAQARRVVLALTDGEDLVSNVSQQSVIDFARANGVSLCIVALGDAEFGPTLQTFARGTGGLVLEAPGPQDLQRLYIALAQQLRREYRITLRTPNARQDATRRNLQLRIARTPFTAETWYQAPGQGSMLVTAPAEVRPTDSASGGSSGAPGPSSPIRNLAYLLLGAGGFCAIAALTVWYGLRHRGAAPVDDRPDLQPLWATDGIIRIGRSPECELILDSHEVSRHHARLESVAGVFTVYDHGSANGTFVNGRRVRKSRAVLPGDVLRFGDREFRFGGELPD